MMSSLLEPVDFEIASNSCCLEDEVLERDSLPDSEPELFCNNETLANDISAKKSDNISNNSFASIDYEKLEEVLLVDADAISSGNDYVVLKMDSRSNESKTISLTGKMLHLADGTIAFIEHSKNTEKDTYTPIKLNNGGSLYLLTSTLLGAIGDPKTNAAQKAEKSKGFPCSYANCTKSYASLHHLKVHMRVHTGVRPFKCPEPKCNKAFSTGFGLKTHIRTHNGERPYHCRHRGCEKRFKTSGDLNKHIRIHTGERPFMCPIPECGRTFTTCNICKVHVRTHTGERPYACTYDGCNKTFSSVTNQRNHLRIHSGEKPYICEVPECGRRFTEYSSLYKHNQIHQVGPHICVECGAAFKTAQALSTHVKSTHDATLVEIL